MAWAQALAEAGVMCGSEALDGELRAAPQRLRGAADREERRYGVTPCLRR